jgi:RNA polymerase sigma factor (sigma-70 family)
VGEFEGFVAEHYEPVRRALSLTLRDATRAEDVTQEAFAVAIRKWASVSTMDRPRAWLYVVALRRARRDLRRDANPPAALLPTPAPDPAGVVAASAALRQALLALTVRQRAVVVLRYLGGLTNREVAAALGCAEGTVKATLHTALAHLRVDMEDDDAG